MKRFENVGEIGLTSILRLAFKNIFSIFYFSIVGLILGLIAVNTVIMPKYTATGSLAMKVSANATVLNTITEISKSSNVAQLALISLEENGIQLENGEQITLDYIQEGIQSTYLATSLNITVTFTSNQKDSSVQILNAILDATVEYANENYSVINNNLIVGEYSSGSIYSGQSSELIIMLSMIAGVVFGALIGFTTDLMSGKILFFEDFKNTSIPSYYFSFQTSDKSDFLKDNIVRLQNNIESQYIAKPLKSVGFINIDSELNGYQIIQHMAYQYSENHLKTLVIDLNLVNPSIHSLFGVSNDINIITVIENKFYQKPLFKRINEYLFVLPAKDIIYPARILKNQNFAKMYESIIGDFDIILFNLGSYDKSDSSFVSLPYIDLLVMNVELNLTKKGDIIKYINELEKMNYQHFFVNVMCKKRKKFLKENFHLFFKNKR